MAILSVQSWVATGHVGNAAALFPLQRLGLETWAVPTWVGSNHPGHGRFHGGPLDAALVSGMLQAIAARGLVARCDAVLSGYLGDAAVGRAIADAVAAARAANPRAIYCCDPVIGDRAEGVYVRPGVPEVFRDRLVPVADVLTPNQFELEWLAGRTLASEVDVRGAAADLAHARPGRTVLVTSVEAGTPAGTQRLLAVQGDRAWRLDHPTVDVRVKGTGDLIAALFLAGLLRGGAAPDALAFAAAAIHAVLERTRAAGTDELALVEAGDDLAAPPRRFAVEALP